MKIELTSEQETYRRDLVSSGAYPSVKDAIADILAPNKDDPWMKPYVDEALADIDAGRTAPWNADKLRNELINRYPAVANGSDR